MGVYRYTLRAPTKTVDGRVIGQFKFAYKCHWDAHRSRVCMGLEAAGERARDKLFGEIELFVQGDWYDGQPVFWLAKPCAGFTEELRTAPVVGTLYKDSRGRWRFLRKTYFELLAQHSEVGTLTDESGGTVYYTNESWGPVRTSNLYLACTNALTKRLSSRY